MNASAPRAPHAALLQKSWHNSLLHGPIAYIWTYSERFPQLTVNHMHRRGMRMADTIFLTLPVALLQTWIGMRCSDPGYETRQANLIRNIRERQLRNDD